jgi:hypothetical protein
MTPVLTFIAGPLERELVRLGDVVIGEVAPHNGSRRTHATFTIRLPECSSSFRPAESIERARGIVASEVREWLTRAGVIRPGETVEIQRQ